MAKEIKTALAEIARQLQEQLAFYGAIGIGDIGSSQAGPQSAAARPTEKPVITPPEPIRAAGTEAEKLAEAMTLPPAQSAPPAPTPAGLFADLSPAPAKSGLPVLDLASSDLTLEAIRADIGDCTRCKLHEQRTKIVFGEGNPRAQLMFVGEGPGADEDLTGRPFVGRAGQLLDKIIAAIGKKREEVYIGNVVKCRPPGNRTPERDEVETCQPFLFRQIALIKPKVIVTLGSPAFQCLFNTREGISRARGEFRDWNGIRVMPTFHPAYLLRSPDKKREAWEDMKKVRDYLNSLTE